MKSSTTDLRKRGMADEQDLQRMRGLQTKQLLQYLQTGTAVERSAAATLLPVEDLVAEPLLEQLRIEKQLYVRIAICEKLEQGNVNWARKMLLYIDKIGKNQLKEVPERPSAKKTYPLARDMVARSLGRMSTKVLPIMLEALENEDSGFLSELLDAIGHMVFYHQELATMENTHILCQFRRKWERNELLAWKTIVCLSAFSQPEAVEVLETLVQEPGIISAEAERSLRMIRMHRKEAE